MPQVAVFLDPDMAFLKELRPDVLVDATIAKRNMGVTRDLAPLVIGVGPGFDPPRDCHAAVETSRGHLLGRVLYDAPPLPDSGVPGAILGITSDRVLRAPCAGTIRVLEDLGAVVAAGQVVATIDGTPMRTKIGGVVRGMLMDGFHVPSAHFKVGDVDPRGDVSYCTKISDKARTVSGAVLEIVVRGLGVVRRAGARAGGIYED